MYPQHRKMATEEGKETCPWSRRDAGDIRAHSLKKRTSTRQAVHLCLCNTEHVRPGDRSGPSLLQRRRQRPETRRDFPKSPARQRQSRAPVREDRPRFREEVQTEMEFHLCPRNISLFLSPPSVASCPREAWKPFWSFRSKSPLHAPVLESLHTSSRLERSRGTQYARF